MSKSKYIIGVYDDEEKLLRAVDNIQGRGIRIADAYTPFPVHGLPEALGLRRSAIPKVGFWFGALGAVSAILLQTYMLTWDWPIDIGGKPYFPFPSFIPITFELTVLFCALGMVGTYLYINYLKPGYEPTLADPRQTDDRFVLAVSAADESTDNLTRQAFRDSGALDVRDTELERKGKL